MPKMTLQLSPELAERLRTVADRQHRSMHGQMLTYIERGLDQDEAARGAVHHKDGDPRNNDPANLEISEG